MAQILIAEDDLLIQRMLAMRLELRGHSVVLTDNGQSALEAALGGEFDIICMDMHMPVMDGHQATAELRERGYAGLIVAVTASAMSSDTSRALEAGCDGHIPKPIGADFEDLIEAYIKAGR